MEFPLKTDFFPQVRLTAEERRRYVSTGESSAMVLRDSMKTLDWKKTKEKDGVTFAQAHCIEGSDSAPNSPSASEAAGREQNPAPLSASACLMMSATAFAAGTVSEALEALASPVTEDYRRTMHFLHGSRFIDGVCLYTMTGTAGETSSNNGPSSRKSNSQAFTTIKWAAFDDGKPFNTAGSPAGTDYCFLEHSGIYRTRSGSGSDADGSADPDMFGFSVQESISREREVPSLAGVGFARGHFHRTGILILPTDRADVVQITSILQMRMTEGATLMSANDANSSAQALARRMRRRVAAVGRLDLFLERRRLNKLEHVPRSEWVADDARKACAVCVKPFALRRRKHHCRHCGEVVCASCAPAREVDVDTANTDTMHVRICTACVVKARAGSQLPGGYDVFVYHLRRACSLPSSSSSTNSTSESPTPASSNNAEHEQEDHPQALSLSSGSSSFSISSDSQMSARLTRAGYADGAIRLYGYEDRQPDESSRSSSSYSLSEFDAFDNLVVLPASNQEGVDSTEYPSGQRRRSAQPDPSSPGCGRSTELSGDLLERIRGMKADLSTLTTSFRHLSNADSTASASNSTTIEDTDTPRSVTHLTSPTAATDDRNVRRSAHRGARGSDAGMDVDYINDNEHFSLLCPETLRRRWRTRTSSHVRQDAGEKSHLSLSLSASNMSFVSTLSNSTMLDDDGDAAPEQDQRESQELEQEGIGAGGRSESQAELMALRAQVEGLHRSLEAATTQLNSIRSRRASRQAQAPVVDPVAARHQATYGLLVEELHELMGLPRPGREH